jgi:hypothetical protein
MVVSVEHCRACGGRVSASVLSISLESSTICSGFAAAAIAGRGFQGFAGQLCLWQGVFARLSLHCSSAFACVQSY